MSEILVLIYFPIDTTKLSPYLHPILYCHHLTLKFTSTMTFALENRTLYSHLQISFIPFAPNYCKVLLALGLLFYRASSASTMMEGRARDITIICTGKV